MLMSSSGGSGGPSGHVAITVAVAVAIVSPTVANGSGEVHVVILFLKHTL